MTTDKAQAAHERLTAEIESFETSEDWRRALAIAARFHHYSFGNSLLIWAQAADRGFEPTRVAGYQTWKSLGRQVRKGERGLTILAPNRAKREDEKTGETTYVLTGFRATAVFDISQTDGDDVPDTGDFVSPLESSSGLAYDFTEAEKILADRGFGLSFVDGPLAAGANGVTNYSTRTVTVRRDLGDVQAFKTTLHELGHVILHDPKGGTRPDCRGEIEVEAESVAYVVASVLGIDTGSYSFGYVAGWADGTGRDASKVVADTGRRVVTAAKEILAAYRKETADA